MGSHKGSPRSRCARDTNGAKNVEFEEEDILYDKSKGQNILFHKNMNPQACDKGYENYLNMKADECLGFRYIRKIFDCFIKGSSFKPLEEDMGIVQYLFRLLFVAL
jgi:hypothetical protein